MAASQIIEQPVLQDMEPSRYRWTTDALYRAIDAGVFDHPKRIELIEGELIQKMGQNPPHPWVTLMLARILRLIFEPQYQVREEKPVHIADVSESEPDIAVVRGNDDDYVDRHPSAADVMLLIEVADTSLRFDTNQKAQLYSKAGIEDYWVVSLPAREVIVHRQPTPNGYASVQSIRSEGSIAPLCIPETAIELESIFPKKTQ